MIPVPPMCTSASSGTTMMAVLIAEFNAYLDRAGADPVADGVGYRQGTFWLSPDEPAEVAMELLGVLQPRLGNQPAAGRRPYLLSAILFPAGDAASERQDPPDVPPGPAGQPG
jgi:hypothetical protein